ncbi:MAG: class I SAM-dependent methyltransferase [Candidatus Marsarchaeota archaeon]|nr:class I SAM-dependent methyltransferase [Candidatus Marsarchaeota archaeon]
MELINGTLHSKSEEDGRRELAYWDHEWTHGEGNSSSLQVGALPKIRNKHVLDVGCGDLEDTRVPVASGSFTGIDISVAALRNAQRNTRRARRKVDFVAASAEFMPFRNNAFEAVISVETLTIMGHNFKDVAAEMARVTREQVGLCVTPGGDDPRELRYVGVEKTDYGIIHHREDFCNAFFTKEGVQLLLREVGLRPDQVGTTEELAAASRKERRHDPIETIAISDDRIFARASKIAFGTAESPL